MLVCVTSAGDSSAARHDACASPLVLDVACTSETSQSIIGATARVVALPAFVLLASDDLSALPLFLSEISCDRALDRLQLVWRRASRLPCLQKFLKPGLLLPADFGKSPTTSNLVGVVGAKGLPAAGVVGAGGVPAAGVLQALVGIEAEGTREAALMEVWIALKKCISRNWLAPMSSFTPMSSCT